MLNNSQKCKLYYLRHKDKVKQRQAIYRSKNRKYFAAYAKTHPRPHWQEKDHARKKEVWLAARKRYLKTEKGKLNQMNIGLTRRTRLGLPLDKKAWIETRNKSPMCPMCGRFVGCENLTLDYILPVSKGGDNQSWNIQALCLPCNSSKGSFVR